MSACVCVCVCVEAYRRLCGPAASSGGVSADICETFAGLCENGECVATPGGSFRCECQSGYKPTSQPTQCTGLSLSLSVLQLLHTHTHTRHHS